MLIDIHVFCDVIKQVRAHEKPVFVSLQIKVTSIHNQLCTLVDAGLHKTLNVGFCGCCHDGTVVHISARSIRSDFQRLNAWHQLFDQPVSCLIAYGNSYRNGHATLASSTVTRTHQSICSLVHIRVRHDNHVVFRAAKTLDAFAVRTARRIDIFSNRSRAHEANRLNGVIVQDCIDGHFIAVHNLQNTFGQTGFFHQFCKHQRHGWVTLGRLEDKRVTAGNRGRKHPHRDHRRKVERRNARRHPKRLAHGIHINAGARAVGVFALQKMRRTDAIFNHFKTALHVPFGIWNSLAMLTAQGLGQFLHIAVQQIYKLHQHPCAALRVHRCPRWLCLCCNLNGMGHFGLRGQGHLRLNFTCSGVKHIRKTARGSFDVGTIDVMS